MIKAVIYIALFVGILYTGFLFGTPYYNYRVFKSDLDEMAKVESAVMINRRDKFMEKILELAENSSIPITEEDIELHSDESQRNHIDISVEWTETVDLYGAYQHTYKFQIDT